MKLFTAKIGDITEDLRSGFASGDDDPTGVMQFRMNNVDRAGAVNWDKVRRVPATLVKPELVVQSGDILFNATNSPELVGKTALFAALDEPVTFSNHFLRVRTRRAVADPGYVARWLQREFERGRFAAMCRAWVNQASITKDQLSSLALPLPPLDDQRRIAAILDKADALRQKRKRAIALLGSLTQSIFLEMFGTADPSWSTATIAEVGTNIRTGPFGSQLLHSEFVDNGIAVLGIDNAVQNNFVWAKPRFITEEKYSSLRRYKVHPGDVLITIMGTIGRCAVVPDDVGEAINTKHLCCITADKTRVLPEYLKATFLGHPDVLRQLGAQSKGAIMDGLNMGIIKGLAIPIPPLDLQRKFSASVATIAATLKSMIGLHHAADDLFASLQHRAFSGQL